MSGDDLKLQMGTLKPNAKLIVNGKPANREQIIGSFKKMTETGMGIIMTAGKCTTTTPEKGLKITSCTGGIIRMKETPTAARMDVVEFGSNNTSKNYYIDIDKSKNVAKAGCTDQAGNVCQ